MCGQECRRVQANGREILKSMEPLADGQVDLGEEAGGGRSGLDYGDNGELLQSL